MNSVWKDRYSTEETNCNEVALSDPQYCTLGHLRVREYNNPFDTMVMDYLISQEFENQFSNQSKRMIFATVNKGIEHVPKKCPACKKKNTLSLKWVDRDLNFGKLAGSKALKGATMAIHIPSYVCKKCEYQGVSQRIEFLETIATHWMREGTDGLTRHQTTKSPHTIKYEGFLVPCWAAARPVQQFHKSLGSALAWGRRLRTVRTKFVPIEDEFAPD